MGLNGCNNQTSSYSFATAIVCFDGIEMLHLTKYNIT